MSEIEIRVQDDWMRNRVKVFAIEHSSVKPKWLHFDGEKIIQQETKDDGTIEEIKPLFECNPHLFQLLIQSLTEEGNKRGIKTENENLLKGKLEATEHHLKDLQQISKKLLKISDD